MTVTTKENEDTGIKGDLFYDGDCLLCSRWKARFEKPLNKLGYGHRSWRVPAFS